MERCCYVCRGPTAYLEWGIGLGYKMRLIYGQISSFFTEKIFSKPSEYIPKYKIRNLNGDENQIYGKKSNHFINMFNNFYNMLGS